MPRIVGPDEGGEVPDDLTIADEEQRVLNRQHVDDLGKEGTQVLVVMTAA
jgi:hypothetical protein